MHRPPADAVGCVLEGSSTPLGDMLITAGDRGGRAGAVSQRPCTLNLAELVFLGRSHISPGQTIRFMGTQANALLKRIPARKTVTQVASGALPPGEQGFLGEQVAVLADLCCTVTVGGGWAHTPCISTSARDERRRDGSRARRFRKLYGSSARGPNISFFLSVSLQGGAIHIKTKYAWACLHVAARREDRESGQEGTLLWSGVFIGLFRPWGRSGSMLTRSLLTDLTAFQVG